MKCIQLQPKPQRMKIGKNSLLAERALKAGTPAKLRTSLIWKTRKFKKLQHITPVVKVNNLCTPYFV